MVRTNKHNPHRLTKFLPSRCNFPQILTANSWRHPDFPTAPHDYR